MRGAGEEYSSHAHRRRRRKRSHDRSQKVALGPVLYHGGAFKTSSVSVYFRTIGRFADDANNLQYISVLLSELHEI